MRCQRVHQQATECFLKKVYIIYLTPVSLIEYIYTRFGFGWFAHTVRLYDAIGSIDENNETVECWQSLSITISRWDFGAQPKCNAMYEGQETVEQVYLICKKGRRIGIEMEWMDQFSGQRRAIAHFYDKTKCPLDK